MNTIIIKTFRNLHCRELIEWKIKNNNVLNAYKTLKYSIIFFSNYRVCGWNSKDLRDNGFF